jgi:hypothetical protein
MGDAEPAGADPRDADGGDECAVCVCVHIRPLVAPELLEGCQECLSVTPGQPQARPCAHAQICALALVSSTEVPARPGLRRAALVHVRPCVWRRRRRREP